MAGLWYRVGTASVTNGSKKITGFGTQWASAVIKPKKGHTVHAPDGRQYELDYVESDTVMYIVTAYAGVTATGQAYAIDITRSDTIPAFSRDLASFTAYAQGQYDSWQQVLTGTGMVTLTAPDGQQIQVPALSAFQPTSASLKALQALTPAADRLGYFSGAAGAALTPLTPFARTLLDDADPTAALVTLGAFSRAGGDITGDFWRASGSNRFGMVKALGLHADGKASLVLLAKKYVGTLLAKTGFVGRIVYSRGTSGSNHQTDHVDVSVASAFNSNQARLFRRVGTTANTPKLVEVTYNSEVYFALYRPAASAADVAAIGQAFDGALPLLIPDATAYSITDVATTEEDYHRGSVIGEVSQLSGVPTGALIEEGSNANGYYWKFAGGMAITLCTMSLSAIAITATAGNLFQTATAMTITLPITLNTVIRPALEVVYTSGGLRPFPILTTVTASSIAFVLQSGGSVASFSGTAYAIVLGRWY